MATTSFHHIVNFSVRILFHFTSSIILELEPPNTIFHALNFILFLSKLVLLFEHLDSILVDTSFSCPKDWDRHGGADAAGARRHHIIEASSVFNVNEARHTCYISGELE